MAAEDDLQEIQLLGEDVERGWVEGATAERDPGRWGLWAGLGAAVVGLVLGVGWLLDDGPGPESKAAPIDSGAMVEQFSDRTKDRRPFDPLGGDATPALTPDGVPEGVVGPFDGRPAVPDELGPPGHPSGTWLLGHNSNGDLISISAVGEVRQVLRGDGIRFLPQVSSSVSTIGTLTFTGEWIAMRPTGTASLIRLDDTDAPIFIAGSGPGTFVMHQLNSGRIRYTDPDGQVISEGPVLAPDTEVIGDSSMGLVVVGLDGQGRVLDHRDGTIISDLDIRPIHATGSTVVGVRCPDSRRCEVVALSLVDDTAVVLPVDPERAERSVLGLSEGGGWVAYRSGRTTEVAAARTGAVELTYEGSALGGMSWLGDKFVVFWEEDGSMSLGNLVDLTVTPLDVEGQIDPMLRGIALLGN